MCSIKGLAKWFYLLGLVNFFAERDAVPIEPARKMVHGCSKNTLFLVPKFHFLSSSKNSIV